ncbi:peptidoglycan-binding domain-containing protein [Nocardioides nanhaiensis]|uniref:Peptidoglycan binding-like domain-containing protein n=1 Tax=Nocardioides nanhaiensis TaxID=1476871 RepID=A0ABP8WWU1_9ACTN
MAFLGADTDELREVGQQFQEGADTVDTIISFVQALIALLRAASFFTGGASAAYATYLETTVLPWLKKISMALKAFAQVLNLNADAQDEISNGGSVDLGALPQYQTPALPPPSQPYDGGDIAGGVPAGTPAGGAPATGEPGTTPLGTLGVDEDGHLVLTPTGETAGSPAGSAGSTPGAGSTPAAGERPGDQRVSTFAGIQPSPGSADGALGGRGSIDGGGAGSGAGGGSGAGSTGGGSAAQPFGAGGGLDGVSGAGSSGSPLGHSTATAADGGLGGATPGADALTGHSAGGLTSAGEPASKTGEGPNVAAAAGVAGGAAALGLGGAALAAKGAGGGDPKIDALAAGNGRGSRGGEVTQLQERLTAAGYDTRGADGVWGANTQAAYDAYRADHPLPVQAGEGYTSPGGYDYQQITGVRGNPNVTPEFLRQVEGMSQRLGAQPEHMLAAMSFETGGTFASDVKNPRSSATGLIQFMDATARGLGTSTSELAQMSPTEQLAYVERYFEPYRGRLGDLESVYTSILAGSPHSGEEALFTQGEKAYGPNRELDADRNGVITAAEATAHVRSRMGSGN